MCERSWLFKATVHKGTVVTERSKRIHYVYTAPHMKLDNLPYECGILTWHTDICDFTEVRTVDGNLSYKHRHYDTV